MDDSTYELFAVDSDSGPLWLESISGLENAKRCMEQRAAELPGEYFVYNAREGAVVATEYIDQNNLAGYPTSLSGH